MNDYAIPDNASFLRFSEKCQENLGNQDLGLLVFIVLFHQEHE
jgi:hypothetical protein